MHPFALVPLISAIGAGVLSTAVAAREPDRRANRLASIILLGAAFWSACDFLRHIAPDAATAASLIRWTSLGSLTVGPLALHLLVTAREPALDGFRRWLGPAYGLAAMALMIAVGTNLVIVDAHRVDWGWEALTGPLLPAVYAAVVIPPVLALAQWYGGARRRSGASGRFTSFEIGGAFCFAAATVTDFVLPLLGVSCPRLGSASLVAWGGIAWASVYRFREPRLAARRYAREVLETLPDGVALLRPDGRIRISNEKLATLAERPARDLMGLEITDVLAESSPSSRTGLLPEFPRDREGELVAASGLRIPVAIAEAPLMDEEGRAAGHVVVARDMREVVALRSRLASAGRLAAVGQLAAGIAHEINNPIAYVRSNLGLLRRHWNEIEKALGDARPGSETFGEGGELLDEAAEGVDRVAAIVRDVGGFSRGGAIEKELADLRELLDTAARVAAPQVKQAEIQRDFREIAPVLCVPQELMQVFLNLILNAAQSLDGDSGTIRLCSRTDGDQVVVEVADNGSGIGPETLARIFEPFFTTKPVGVGTGLGLSISRQIVTKHRGEIEAMSEPGHGTTFRVRMPAAPSEEAGS